MTIYRVYKLTCKTTGKIYIGATSKSSNERFMRHVYQSNWKATTCLHKSIQLYGHDDFIVETLETSDDREYIFNTAEPKYILEYDSKHNGLNSTDGGEGLYGCTVPSRGMLGKTHKPESIQKRLDTLRRNGGLSEDARRRISEGSKNRAFTPETRAKISKALTGRKRSPSECEAISLGQKGIKPSAESRAKMRKAKELHNTYEVTTPNGVIEIIHNLAEYSRVNNLNKQCMSNVVVGIQTHHKGYSVVRIK